MAWSDGLGLTAAEIKQMEKDDPTLAASSSSSSTGSGKVDKKALSKLNSPITSTAQANAAIAAPNYAGDTTYQQQLAYYNKVMADFKASQIRKTGELQTYYGAQARPSVQKTKAVTSKVKGKNVTTQVPQFKTTKKLLGEAMPTQPKSKVKGKYVTLPLPLNQKNKAPGTPLYQTTRTPILKSKAVGPTEGVYQKQLRLSQKKDLQTIKDDYASRGILHSGLFAQKNADYNTEFGQQLAEQNRKKASSFGDINEQATQFNRAQQLQKSQAKLEAVRRAAAAKGTFLP